MNRCRVCSPVVSELNVEQLSSFDEKRWSSYGDIGLLIMNRRHGETEGIMQLCFVSSGLFYECFFGVTFGSHMFSLRALQDPGENRTTNHTTQSAEEWPPSADHLLELV